MIFYIFVALKMVAIAQLVRALDCGSKGRGFEPHWLPKKTSFRLRQNGVFFFFRIDFSYILKNVGFFHTAIHQKPLLKGDKGKKNSVFALFLDYV